jgi:hypothetical protein
VESQIKKEFERVSPKSRFNQGDIIKDLDVGVVDDYDTSTKEHSVSLIHLPYGVVISQECDLEHDYKNRDDNAILGRENITSKVIKHDKYLPNILILPAYPATDFKLGIHRSELSCQQWSSDEYKKIKSNQNARFHYIKPFTDLQIQELVIDFKHLYTIDTNVFYKIIDDVYLASICEIFRENLSSRYCHYLSRIGLPEINTPV